MFKDGLLAGKRILITGGGTGLGREIAARYLALGAEIWIGGRRGPVLSGDRYACLFDARAVHDDLPCAGPADSFLARSPGRSESGGAPW